MRLIIILFPLLLHSCAGRKPVASTPGTPATVIDYSELDGCGFLLELEDGRKLEPVNLEQEYMKHGLKVLIKWRTVNGMSICMVGTMVEITSIRLAE